MFYISFQGVLNELGILLGLPQPQVPNGNIGNPPLVGIQEGVSSSPSSSSSSSTPPPALPAPIAPPLLPLVPINLSDESSGEFEEAP